MALKADLRKAYLVQRRGMSEQEAEALSQDIARQFFTHFQPKAGQTVHTFLPIQHHREINTWYIIQEIWDRYPDVQVSVPISDLKDGSMSHFLLMPDTELQENRLGIPEPVNALPLPESEITTVLVPLLAFDRQGHRVGYGKGFYDRFLALLPQNSQKIGISFLPPIDRIDDVHANDLVLDAVVTPEKVWTFDVEKKGPSSEQDSEDIQEEA
ncbi:5-formyltetrahydrofolate cyclo-ligase [Rufibacter radiotolerans]|uniref:5-formyltetrahydrofolate cyclo-ligase n=1 Tax=Rufibacter radiotolerans TaxID=1379910 RepID=UPI00097155AB|nr:5-formyltetrahydrofolate cyclo-ligase [Rufibacter radiotolerans]